MAKIFKGDVNFGFVINQTGAQPLDSRSVVQNYEELLKSETFGSAIYNGMTVATVDEQKVYMLIDKTKATVADGWKEVGAGGAVAVDTYAEAVVLATSDNIGQVIFVKTSDETYERAPYIVTGEGSLQKLAASNSDGTGLDADVAKLKETVGDANSGLVKSVADLNDSKVDKVEGSRLMTDAEGAKLAGIAEGAEVNVVKSVGDNLTVDADGRLTVDMSSKVNKSDYETKIGEINGTLSGKADAQTVADHIASTNIHVSLDEKAAWNNAEKNAKEYADGLNTAMGGRMTTVEGDVATLKAINHDAYIAADEALKTELQGNIDLKASIEYVDGTFLKSAEKYNDTEVRGLITAEKEAREGAVDTLQGAIEEVAGNLADEVSARETLNTTLRGLITAEKEAREGAISGEATARGELAIALRGEIAAAQGAAEKAATDFNTAMDSRVAKLEAIDHKELMSDAINAWANQVTDDNTTVDTFKELIDYAATHSSEYSELAGVVQGLTTSKADASALTQEVTDRKAADAELQGAINTEKSARETAISEVNAEVAKKANQTDLDALNTIIGKASVEGENGSGLVKRVEDLEAIDHNAYKSADATLKSELQGEISKKANASDLNTEVSAREALATLVGARAEGDNEDVFTKLAALVAKNGSQDEEIAKKAAQSDLDALSGVVDTKAAQSDLDALAGIVGKESEESGIFAKLKALASKDTEHDNAITALQALKVNNKAFDEGAVVLDAGDIALESAIMSDNGEGDPVEQYAATSSIHSVLQSLNNRITAAVSGGLTSVAAGSGIEVSSVIGNSQTVSIKVSAADNNAVTLNTDGIYVERLMVNGNDVE